MKARKHSLAPLLQNLIKQQDSTKYHTTIPYTKVCAQQKCKTEWWVKKCWCVKHKLVKLPPKLHPFKGNQKIGAVATLEAEDEDIEILE